MERTILCVCILLREELGLFWAVFDDLILLFMYSPPHERELRSQVVSVFFSLTHCFSFMQTRTCAHTHRHTRTQIHIYLAIFNNFHKYLSSLSALFVFVPPPSLCQNWVDSVSSSVIWHVCVYVHVQLIVFARACTCLMKAPAVFVPLVHPSDR